MTLGVSLFDSKGMEIEVLDRRIDSIIITIMGPRLLAVGLADLDAQVVVRSLDRKA